METLIKKETLPDGIQIELHDFSKGLDSKENMLSIIEKVAGLSFGKDTVKNPEALFNHLKTESGGNPSSVLEFLWSDLKYYKISYNRELYKDHVNFITKLVKYGISREYGCCDVYHYYSGNINMRTALELGLENDIKPDPEWCKKNIYTFKLKIPLFIFSQIVRHRQASYMSISRRRVKGNFEFYRSKRDKDIIINYPDCFDDYKEEMDDNDFIELCIQRYEEKLKQGVPAEVARGVLPQNLFTEIWCQFVNTDESLKNFIALRTDEKHTQLETAETCKVMKKLLDEYLEGAQL